VSEPTAQAARPLLEIEDLNAYYGSARALEDVSFRMERESVAIIGRNGMGKTTLCTAIMGVPPARTTGSIRFEGREIRAQASHRTAKLGIGYVPQGRRLFPSLSVHEHLQMVESRRGNGDRWTIDRVYDLFPRLRDRRRNGGAELSGGEQQMLAVGRALLTNPKLLVMDEPSEGLAPVVISSLAETLKRLEEEGIAILLIEQNLGLAVTVAKRQVVMVSGRLAAETTAQELSENPELQRRFLGVEPLTADTDEPAAGPEAH
jgi:branched-chain amino acid transport system ATP-binding protein